MQEEGERATAAGLNSAFVVCFCRAAADCVEDLKGYPEQNQITTEELEANIEGTETGIEAIKRGIQHLESQRLMN